MTQHIFLHIPKTAGSSIRTLLTQNYPAASIIGFSGDPGPLEWYAARDAEFKAQYRLVHGHFAYGVHAPVPSYAYFTFLRDPVDRHFSDYFFLKRYDQHALHEAVASGRITIADWARIHETLPEYRDLTTRRISGDGDARDPDRFSLERAKYLLATEFCCVGLSARFDESVLIVAKRLGWRSVFYLTKNVSTNGESPAPALRAAALRGLEYNTELYRFAQDIFASSPELRDPLFPAALAELRAAKRWLDSHLHSDPAALFLVGNDLPPLDALVRAHVLTPALDRFLTVRSLQSA